MQQAVHHHLSGLVGAGSEGHPGINHYLCLPFADCHRVLLVVDDAESVDVDRLKTFLFPGGVPVAVFGLFQVVADTDVGDGEICQEGIEQLAVEKVLLHISCERSLFFAETFKACL